MARESAARRRCYEEIVALAVKGLEHYYRLYPERIGDERADDARRWSTDGVEGIIRILDTYEIREKTDARKDTP